MIPETFVHIFHSFCLFATRAFTVIITMESGDCVSPQYIKCCVLWQMSGILSYCSVTE